ncbi:Coq4 family protein [Capilliphycus salinus ALCB114379]|uniref:Coq4 family protein n=1 Tax=Capilliphycus salinus TaxID=2768948 RepID=UPI0039A41701
MKPDIKSFFQVIKLAKNTDYLGDVAILKAEAFGVKLNPKLESKMRSVVGYHPKIDLEKLSQLPPETLGYQYAQHMKINNLQPFEISPEVSRIAEKNVFSLRYSITHDLFHVLLDFDTSYAGEIGVLAFAAEQNYSRTLKLSLVMARLLYPILAPQQIPQIFANLRRGREFGKTAQFLLSYRFEENWERPLTEIKAELGLV